MIWKNKGHEFDEIGKRFFEKEKVYIYGAGEDGRFLFSQLQFADCVAGFIDNDKEKQNTGYCGKKVESIHEFMKKKIGEQIVVVAVGQFLADYMMNSLRTIGYQDGINLFRKSDFYHYYLPIYAMYSWNCVYFRSISLTLTTKCTLNCNACLTFMPYNHEQKHYDLEMFKSSLDLFFQAVDFVEFIDIAGGEPLLYPYITEVIDYIGKNYREQTNRVYITTNGTIVPSDELCETMKKYDFMFNLDDYRDSTGDKLSKVPEIVKKLEQKKAPYQIKRVDQWIDLRIMETDNSYMSEEELRDHFVACQQEWPELYNEKIYFCDYSNYAFRAGIAKDYVEEAFSLTNYDESQKKMLFEYMMGYSDKGYVEMCRYCSGYHGTNTNLVESARQLEQKQEIARRF